MVAEDPIAQFMDIEGPTPEGYLRYVFRDQRTGLFGVIVRASDVEAQFPGTLAAIQAGKLRRTAEPRSTPQGNAAWATVQKQKRGKTRRFARPRTRSASLVARAGGYWFGALMGAVPRRHESASTRSANGGSCSASR